MPSNFSGKSIAAKHLLTGGCLSLPIFMAVLALVFLPTIKASTTGAWDGFFPSGEYHIKIINQAHEPIQGAKLSIFANGTQIPAFEYPIDNYTKSNELISNELGLIIATHRSRGFEFGGTCNFLIFCTERPKYDFLITADGYNSIQFSDDIIYKLDSNSDVIGKSKVILDNSQEQEISVFELIYVLEK